jgi:WhiB family redox-sensing transcriptional regulator
MNAAATPARHRALGDHTWQDQAVCWPTEHHQVDPEVFFPEPDETGKIAAAKALCDQCPVKDACLDAALEAHDTHGIRGGLTEEERGPLHDETVGRLDYSRVNAALAGRDIHLSKAERRAVVAAGYRHGVPVEQLARLLKISEEHAQKLYRETCRAIRKRDLRHTADTPQRPAHSHELTRDDFGTAA